MSKAISGILIFVTLFFALSQFGTSGKETDTIPEDSIRLRIIANSNSNIDQEIKLEIRDEVIAYLHKKLNDVDDYENARELIYQEVEALNGVVNEVLKKHQLDIDYYVDYGLTNFPTKVYGEKMYQAGQYESVYIVLGEGKGDNWWCVLFPPLCLVDVNIDDNGISEFEDVEYSFYFLEKIKELFSDK